MREVFGLEVAAKSLYIEEDGGSFEPVIGDPGDGASPSCAITDEYHEHATAAQYDTMRTGMAARDQPLSLVITTAGSNTGGPCYEKQQHLQKVLEGSLDDDSLFGVIYTIDPPEYDAQGNQIGGDVWTSVEAQKKANPNYGVSVLPAFLDKQLREAMQQAAKQNNYKTKHLNIWCGAATVWMNMEKWAACRDPGLKLEDFEGQDYWEADDLSSKIDITARIKVFIRGIEDERKLVRRHYYVFGNYYLPEARAMDEDCQHYQKWVHEKVLSTTPGAEIQYGVIKADILADTKRFAARSIAFDPWGATQLQQELTAELPADTVITIPQQTKFLSEPMKEVEAAVLSGRLHHNGDQMLSWMISNVVARKDAQENVFPTKERSANKIDGAVALIMAVSRAMIAAPKKKSVYSSRGLRSL
jgi:phage terminase large subunit-like protein